jgi:outer membrane protein assembly factor BamB
MKNTMKSTIGLLAVTTALVVGGPRLLRAAQPGQTLWEFEVDTLCDMCGIRGCPALGTDGTLYFGTEFTCTCTFYALDGATGQKRWALATDGMGLSPAVGTDGTVYAGDLLRALDGATGATRWSVWGSLAWGGNADPAIAADGTVYFVAGNKVHALDGATGATRWTNALDSYASSPQSLAADGTMYLGGWDNKVHALNGATGQKVWEFQTGGYVSEAAIGADNTVYVASADKKIYALDGGSGVKRWEFLTGGPVWQFEGPCSPVIGPENTVYVAAAARYGSDRVYALDGATGQKVWESQTPGGWLAVAADGTLYVGSDKLYALNGATGLITWKSQTPGGFLTVAADGTVYVASGRRLYAIKGSAPLARSPWPKYRADAQNTGQAPGQPPRFGRLPSIRILKEGGEGRITVPVSSTATPQLQWFFNGTAVAGGTNVTLILPAVARASEGSYWLVASNAVGQATSAPILAVVSNVDPEPFVALRWRAHTQSELALQSADAVGGPWYNLSNYPPTATEQRFVELESAPARFYRLKASGLEPVLPPMFTKAGFVNGWWYADAVGTKHQIEYVAAATGWTNWLTLTNLVLPTSPYLYTDEESLTSPGRVYRTTPVP